MIEPRRVSFGIFPTPITHAQKLSAELGVELWIKDESQTRFAMGGNKIRSVEYVCGDHQDWDVLLLAGGCHSNFIRACAVGALVLGKKVVGSFYGSEPRQAFGNHHLLKILGVPLYFSGDDSRPTSEHLAEKLKKDFLNQGLKVKLVPRGGALPEASFGFYKLQDELEVQLKSMNKVDHLFVPVGTGTTLAGLMIDSSRLKSIGRIWGISCSREFSEIQSHCLSQAQICAGQFQLSSTIKNNVELTDRFLDKGYNKWTEEISRVIRRTATAEGIFLDPIFNAKAFIGLEHLIAEGAIRKGESVLFLNGGGSPELFQIND